MFIITEGIRNLIRARLTSALVIVVITISLIIGGWFFIITAKVQEATRYLESGLEIELFLDDSLSEDAIKTIQINLEQTPRILSAAFISKDSAAALFSQEVGKNIRTLFGDNPLPASLKVRLRAEGLQHTTIDSITLSLKTIPGVTDVIERKEYLIKLAHYRKTLWILHIITTIVLFSISFSLLINATRLSIYSRRKLIEILKLVGARERFISGPFIVEGCLEGLIAGILTSGITFGLLNLISYTTSLKIDTPHYFYAGILGAGCLIGIGGSCYALSRYLRKL